MSQPKLCLHCSRLIGDDVYLPLVAFARNRAAPDGLQTTCRMSKAEISRGSTHPDRLDNGAHPLRVPTPAEAPFVDLYASRPTRKSANRPKALPGVADLRASWEFLYDKTFGVVDIGKS